jgi:Glycosyltransferase
MANMNRTKIKIAIEAQRIFRKNKHGMDFVALETIRELQKADKINEYYILVSPGEDHCLEPTPNFHIIEIKYPSYPLWEQIGLPRALKKIKPDLLHCTSNTAPLFCKTPLILTLHDIIFLEKRQNTNKSLYQNLGWYYRRLVVPQILPKCRKIITVSHFEAERIKDTLKLRNEQIVAVYNGFSKYFRPVDNYSEVTNKYIDKEHYFFFLGNTDPKKNTARTLKAYSLYIQQSTHPLPLLIADLNEDVIDTILREEKIENIKPYLYLPGYIANTDLPAIYSGAKAFIYTSLRESFGIPILEGMACGTPVITSNTSAMPEIAGKEAILVDPYKENEIADKILQLENDSDFYQKQVNYGFERVKKFSWEQTAKSILHIYESIK